MKGGLLTQRQLVVLHLIARGFTDAQIAKRMNISRSTVARHVSDIRIRLDARNRAHAVATAFMREVFTP